MRSLSGNRRFGKLLEIGFAFSVLTAPTAFADDATRPAAPMRLAQLTPPAAPDQGVVPDTNAVIPPAAEPGVAQPMAPAPPAVIPKPFHGSMSFEAGSGKMLNLTLPAANIYVADPKVAEVRPASSTSLFVFGVGPGHTTIAAVDLLGRLLADYDITVRPSGFGAREAQAAIARMIPGSRIQVRAQGKGLMLTGGTATQADASQAVTIAKGFAGEGAIVDNQMTISAPTQVTLNVRIAEMQRTVLRKLGINWNELFTLGQMGGSFGKLGLISGITNGALTFGSGAGLAATAPSGAFLAAAAIDALAQDNLAHILAEPTLTVMSGKPASFQVGGEFPVPVAGQNNTVTVNYKDYGVILEFVATVLSNGRINLHVAPEVSEVTTANSITQQTAAGNQTLPALTKRRAETTVELGSGESLMIAGLLHRETGDASGGIPGLGDTPILGALFRSNTLNRQETETVIVVSPVIVRPVKNMAQLQLPTDGYKTPGDVDRLLLLHQMPTRQDQRARAPGAGFIVQ